MRIHEILTERETTTSSSWEKSNTTDQFSQTGGGVRIDKSVDNPGRAEYFAKKRELDARAAADTEARRQQFLKSKGLENATGREKRSAMDNARFSGEFTDTEPSYNDLGKDPGSHLEVTKKNVPPVNTRTVTSTATNSPAKVTTTPAPSPLQKYQTSQNQQRCHNQKYQQHQPRHVHQLILLQPEKLCLHKQQLLHVDHLQKVDQLMLG